MLTVSLLGEPAFCWQGMRLEPGTQKASACLVFMALQCEGVSRAELSRLLWTNKKGNLRVELHRLRRLEGAELWLKNERLLSVQAKTDVGSFEIAIANEAFADALAIYQGEKHKTFCLRLEPKRAPAFLDWLESERLRLQRLLNIALRGQLDKCERDALYPDALHWARLLLAQDELLESHHRTVIRLELACGNRDAAQKQLEHCHQIMAEQLHIAPSWATRRLLEQ